jgi:hypothetical protein
MFSNLKKEDVPATVVTLVSIVVLAGTLGVMLFMPLPTSGKIQAKFNSDKMLVNKQTNSAIAGAKLTREAVNTMTWAGNLNQISTTALGKVTELAKTHKLSLDSFRPQRLGSIGDLPTQPYLVSVSGAFPDVVGLTKDIETKGTKLAVSMVQITASDQGSDKVTASIALVAYLTPPPPAAPTKPGVNTGGTKNG